MMKKLSRAASGLRHLRWGREIVASLEAHITYNPRLTGAEREALIREAERLTELVRGLSFAVKPYRDFLERKRVTFRARRRVGLFLGEAARRGGDAGVIEEAEAIARAADEAFVAMEAMERLPLKEAVREAVEHLHEGLDRMNDWLGERVDKAMIDALYPDLTRSMMVVVDDADEDDDATEEAAT